MDMKHRVGVGYPHPLHAILLGFPVALFTAALVTDITYLRAAELQWTNFSAWLISGALVFGGLVLGWAMVALILLWRSPERLGRLLYAGLLAVMWVLGLVNAFKHSQDAWSSVGGFGLTLSILCMVFALAAAVVAFSGFAAREAAR